MPRNDICLNMIVRDEAAVIERCLRSVKPYVQRYVICDTGSVDATALLIGETLAGIPGTIYQDQWSDFATNRNLALDRARHTPADYILVIDADEQLRVEGNAAFDLLMADACYVDIVAGELSYPFTRLYSLHQPWRWQSVLHEHPVWPLPHSTQIAAGIEILIDTDLDKVRWENKAPMYLALLQAAVADEPKNARYASMLAEQLQRMARYNDAIEAYRHALRLANTHHEKWTCMYRIARCHEAAGEEGKALYAYARAIAFNSDRAEAYYARGRIYVRRGKLRQALADFRHAAKKEKPEGLVSVDRLIYDYLALQHYGMVCDQLGYHDAAAGVARRLLDAPDVPQSVKASMARVLARLEVIA